MNGTYYQNPTFPNNENEESHSVILNNNLDFQKRITNKKAKIYVTYSNNSPWQTKLFEGIIDEITNDYLILQNILSNNSLIIKTSNIDYIEIEEQIKS